MAICSTAAGLVDGPRRGRGASSNRAGRYERHERVGADDGWSTPDPLPPLRTEVVSEVARTILSRNDSPDLSFDRSINPYRGCEHGCVYCYARPTHAYLGLSPGLDFETKLYAKDNAADVLERELSAPGYRPATIALGAVTDPYQPIERGRGLTRRLLEVLWRTRHPVGVVTKSALVCRDIDLLAPMAAAGLVKVAVSITTLDGDLARAMEPRASTPGRRLEAIRQLAAAGVPTTVMVAPIIPGLNDAEIEAILAAARDVGAVRAGYVTLRLPLELKELFAEWLAEARPERAGRVVKLVRSLHGGRLYAAAFGHRHRGAGPYADMIARRFRLAATRLGLDGAVMPLRTDLFRPPVLPGSQYVLL